MSIAAIQNAALAAVFAVIAVCAFGLAAYYALPPAGPGVTHVIDPSTGLYRRKAWARVVAPLHQLGQRIVHHTPLPHRRFP